MRLGSLFTGIGGFDLAARNVGIETVFQVENNEWCLEVLEKNFPNAKRFKDIQDFDGKPYRGKIDIITGGFPCQPFSVAGKRRGRKDDRYLWPQMLRVIREIQPTYVIGENVPGIIHMALDKVLSDLENEGYKTETFIIPACAKDAPHRRDRIWIVAHSTRKTVRQGTEKHGGQGRKPTEEVEKNLLQYKNRTQDSKNHFPIRPVFSNTNGFGTQVSVKGKFATKQIPFRYGEKGGKKNEPDKWATESGLDRVADGIPCRVDRLRGLGNAIVPQVAEEIFRIILQSESTESKTLNGMETDQDNNPNKGLDLSTLPKSHMEFVDFVVHDLIKLNSRNKIFYENYAKHLGINDKNLVKELTELAITIRARELAHQEKTYRKRFDEIVELYKSQVNLSHRTSQSMLLQQYSTPAPISYLAGIIAGADLSQNVFEPCAGNGLLTIAASPEKTVVNEIDPVRRSHLLVQGYSKVLNLDATQPFYDYEKKFDCVLTNPPFGKMDEKVNYGEHGIKTLEHMMALNALECMSDGGKAAIIIGGHTRYDEKGRIQKGANRIFMDYLYKNYDVIDVIPIDGQLYSRQGTSFDVRLIIISQRRETQRTPPLFDKELDTPIKSFDALYKRVTEHRKFIFPSYYLSLEDYAEYQKATNDYEFSEPSIEDFRKSHGYDVEEAFEDGIELPYDVRISHPELSENITMIPNVEDLEKDAENIFDLLNEEKNDLQTDESVFDDKQKSDHQTILPKKLFDEAEVIHDFLHRGNKPTNYRIIFRQPAPPHLQFVLFKAFHSKSDAKRWAENNALHYFPKNFKTDVIEMGIQSLDVPEVLNGLGAPYLPTSQSCIVLDTIVPDAMDYETHEALKKVKEAVGGDIDEFVRNRLGYASKIELCVALAAEQIDAIALAIYNVEARGQGMIDGDQTGIGKGRVAAAMIRYSVKHGLKPIFLTERPNLFSDLYRDLNAIGSGNLRPFIINAQEDKTDILDENGEMLFDALPQKEQDDIFKKGEIPSRFDFILGTYSQFSSSSGISIKQRYLAKISRENILVLDEAHNASGDGNTGLFFQGMISNSLGVLFLSATFAKRPQNLPLYARKTLMSESNLNRVQFVNAIRSGGVALQEVLSSELVKEAQMIRRERSKEGVEVNYISLDEMEDEHRAIADTITDVLRDIIKFQKEFVTKEVERLDDELADKQIEVEVRKGTVEAGVSNEPYFSRVFNVINQMLFSIKAESVADRAIMRLREGKKPIIAFSSTMSSFIESLTNENGEPVSDGDVIATDFSQVLKRGLESVMQYTVVLPKGKTEKMEFIANQLGPQAELAYWQIMEKIESVSTGISISPIDIIVEKIRSAGFSVAEVTGRKFEIELNEMETDSGIDFSDETDDEFPEINLEEVFGKRKKMMGRIHSRKRIVTNEAFRKFNNNEIDVLLINQSGSTGSSAHAIVTDKVPASKVKQRVMIILQAELDINTEVQKRGRADRTGQIYKPIYDYVTSAIPAEKRLMMMLQRKLKSLDANTTSNQKQSTKILDVPDFLNKYGDLVVTEYLLENVEINRALQDPLNLIDPLNKDKEGEAKEIRRGKTDAAYRVSGRVAVLSTKEQQEFYDAIIRRYNDHVEYVKQTGEYDLEVEEMKLDADTKFRRVVIMGKGGHSSFGKDSILERVEVNVLRKPMKKDELELMMRQSLDGLSPSEHTEMLSKEFGIANEKMLADDLLQAKEQYTRTIDELKNSPRLKSLLAKRGWETYEKAMDLAEDKIKGELASREEKAKLNFQRRENFEKSILKFFHVGRILNYPEWTMNGTVELPAVFVGYGIDRNQKNPFAPSAIKLRFAIASGLRYVVIPSSKIDMIQWIKGSSFELAQKPIDKVGEFWESATRKNHADRTERFIITGNILQALGNYKGKLINYTTKEGGIKKGILMSEYWKAEAEGKQVVIVPATKAFPVLRALPEGGQIIIGKHLSLFRRNGDFMIVVSATRSKGGEFFLNENLLKIINGNNFNKRSDKMIAYFDSSKLKEVLEIMENEIGTSVTVTEFEFDKIIKEYPQLFKEQSFPKLEMLPEVVEDDYEREMELEAEAILLMLELDE